MTSLAIIIPFYKLSVFETTLQSLANQTNANFNVYIGDDASPEDPKPLIDAYTSTLNITYVRFDSNLGGTSLVKQWERCIALKQNEPWLTILGDDDYYEPTVVSSFYDHLQTVNGKTNVVRFTTKTKFLEDNTMTPVFTHPVWEPAIMSYYRKFKGKTRSSLSEHFFTESSYLKYGFTNFPLAWYSDDKAWLDFSNGLPIYTINEAEIVISVSKQSLTGMTSNKVQKLKAQQLFLKSVLKQSSYKLPNHMRFDYVRAFEAVSKTIGQFSYKEKYFVFTQFLVHFGWWSLIKFIKRTIIIH